MKVTKTRLRQIIKEELTGLQKEGYGEDVDKRAIEEAIYALEDKVMPVIYGTPLERAANDLHKRLYAMAEGRLAAMQEGGEYPERGSQEEAQYEVMRQLGLFLATLLNQGHKELADELDQILTQAQDAGLTGRKGW